MKETWAGRNLPTSTIPRHQKSHVRHLMLASGDAEDTQSQNGIDDVVVPS